MPIFKELKLTKKSVKPFMDSVKAYLPSLERLAKLMYGISYEHETACNKPCIICGKGACPYMGIACNIQEHYCEPCKNITKGWHVYIVRCSDGTLYTGCTNDVIKRIKKHNEGKGAKYTKNRRPVALAYCIAVENKSEALKLEYKIKQLSREDKIKLCKYS